MSDIVNRLREGVNGQAENFAMRNEAADRIEQLEREIDEAVLAEREACAAIAAKRPHHSGLEIAELIHERLEMPDPPARAADRIEQLEKHKRLQTEDVMNLGAQLGQARQRIEQLEAALREITSQPNMIGNAKCRTIARAALTPERDAGIGCGKSVIEPWSDQSSPPARQENDDVYPGFRGNNEA